MRRFNASGIGAPRDVQEEKKRSREAVISNFVIFGAFIGVIRVLSFVINRA